MKPGNHAWSEEDLQKLVEMRQAGFSFSEIAKEIDRTTNAVAGKCSNMRRLMPKADPLPKQVISGARSQTRGERFTSFLLGDPPPGRSALDQRASQSIPSNKRQQNG